MCVVMFTYISNEKHCSANRWRGFIMQMDTRTRIHVHRLYTCVHIIYMLALTLHTCNENVYGILHMHDADPKMCVCVEPQGLVHAHH